MVMTSATEAYPLSDAERKDRAALLKRLGVNSAPAIAEVIPINHPARRPLGLKPVLDDVSDPEARGDPHKPWPPSDPAVGEPIYTDRQGHGYHDPVAALVTETNELILGLIEDTRGHFAFKLAEMRAQLAKVEGECEAQRLIIEHLRTQSRGETGRDGSRGAPGRDGVGLAGPQGPPGPKGEPGSKIVAWEIDDSAFVAYPLLSTGDRGAGLHLRGMFEVYNEQVNDTDAAAETDAAARSREIARRELAAKDWANR